MKLFEIHSEPDGSLYMLCYVNEVDAYGMTLPETIKAMELLLARAYETRRAKKGKKGMTEQEMIQELQNKGLLNKQ